MIFMLLYNGRRVLEFYVPFAENKNGMFLVLTIVFEYKRAKWFTYGFWATSKYSHNSIRLNGVLIK